MIECAQCRMWREVIDEWWWVPDEEKAKLRRRIARHKHSFRFLSPEDYNRKMRQQPCPPSLLAHMPGLAH